jgi:hypothetical protein
MQSLSDRITPRTEAFLVAVGLAVLYLLLRSSPFVAPGAFSDDGVYLALGKALAEGEGYRSIYAVGEPVHQRYPPGLPGVHALLWWLGGDLAGVYPAALFVSLLVTSTAAGLVWWVARARLALGVPVSLFFALGPFLLEGSVQYFNLAVSEPWFMAVWAGALVLFPRVAGSPPSDAPEPLDRSGTAIRTGGAAPNELPAAVGLGILVAVGIVFRTQAVILAPAILLGFLIMRTGLRAPLAFSTAVVIPIVLWRIWYGRILARGPVGTQPDEEAYGSWMPDAGITELPARALELGWYQLASYGVYLPDHLTAFRPLGLLLWAAFFGLVLAGALRLLRSHPDLVLACGASLATVVLWPWAQDRFVLTILPFLALLAGNEVERWVRGKPSMGRGVVVGLILLGLLIGARQFQLRNVPDDQLAAMDLQFHPAHYLPSTTRYVLSASYWVLQHTEPETTLLAPQPIGIWLHTGRRVVNAAPALPHVGPVIWHEPGRFLAERLVEDRPDLVVMGSLLHDITRDIATLQGTCPEALEHLGATDRSARVVFFRVRYEDPCLQERVLAPTRQRLGRGT